MKAWMVFLFVLLGIRIVLRGYPQYHDEAYWLSYAISAGALIGAVYYWWLRRSRREQN